MLRFFYILQKTPQQYMLKFVILTTTLFYECVSENRLVYYIIQAEKTDSVTVVQSASEESQTYPTLPQNIVLLTKSFSVVIPGFAGPKIPTRSDWKNAVNRSLQVLKFSSYRSRSDETHC